MNRKLTQIYKKGIYLGFVFRNFIQCRLLKVQKNVRRF